MLEKTMGIRATCVLVFLAVLLPGALSAGSGEHDWIAGHWCYSSDGEEIEEYWLTPQAGETVGLGRSVKSGKISSFEYLRISATESNWQYIAQPGGSAATAFDATGSGPGWIVFENRQHDFPQRSEYRREGEKLTASVSGSGEGNEEMAFTIKYKKCP